MKVCECDLQFFIFVIVIWGVSYFVIVWTDPPLPTLSRDREWQKWRKEIKILLLFLFSNYQAFASDR